MSFAWAKPYEPKTELGRWFDDRMPLPRLVYNAVGGGYPVPLPGPAGVVLFETPGYRGRSVTVDASTAILTGLGRARSVQVLDGTWQLCDGPRFTGRCMQVNSSVPNLDSWGFDGPIQSARPVRGY